MKDEKRPNIWIDTNGQAWLLVEKMSLPEYIRLSAKRCTMTHNGNYYRLLLCGTGISKAVSCWYYADDPTKTTVAIKDRRPFRGTIWKFPE